MPGTDSDHPLLTVITVVRNDLVGFRATSASLAPTLDECVEWIVVDGSDSTSEIPNALTNLGLTHIQVVRDNAEGVYPAMNQGLHLASGVFIYFLNAGDRVKSVSDFKTVLRLLALQSPLWLIARVRFEYTDDRSSIPVLNYTREKKSLFARGRFPPHQGTIAQTQLLRQLGGFDSRFRIASDYQLMLKLSQTDEPLTTDHTLARFQAGGLSSKHWFQAIKEFHRARKEVLKPTGLLSLIESCRTLNQTLRQGTFHLLLAPSRLRDRHGPAAP